MRSAVFLWAGWVGLSVMFAFPCAASMRRTINKDEAKRIADPLLKQMDAHQSPIRKPLVRLTNQLLTDKPSSEPLSRILSKIIDEGESFKIREHEGTKTLVVKRPDEVGSIFLTYEEKAQSPLLTLFRLQGKGNEYSVLFNPSGTPMMDAPGDGGSPSLNVKRKDELLDFTAKSDESNQATALVSDLYLLRMIPWRGWPEKTIRKNRDVPLSGSEIPPPSTMGRGDNASATRTNTFLKHLFTSYDGPSEIGATMEIEKLGEAIRKAKKKRVAEFPNDGETSSILFAHEPGQPPNGIDVTYDREEHSEVVHLREPPTTVKFKAPTHEVTARIPFPANLEEQWKLSLPSSANVVLESDPYQGRNIRGRKWIRFQKPNALYEVGEYGIHIQRTTPIRGK